MKPPYETPHSEEAEEAVLCAFMIQDDAWSQHGEKLTPQHFWLIEHQEVFTACQKLARAGERSDMMLVALECERAKAEVTRKQILAIISKGDPNNTDAYIAILNRHLTRRQAINEANDLLRIAYDEASERADIINQSDKLTRNLHELQVDKKAPVHILKPLKESVQEIERRFNNQGELLGYSSGIAALDKRIHGFQDGNLYILAARPAMGKSTIMNVFAKAIADHCPDKPLVIFTLEMPSRQLVERMISMAGQIRGNRLKTGDMRQEDFASLTAAFNALKGLNIYFDDCTGQTIYDMSAKAKKIYRDHGGLAGLMVDHIGLISPTNPRQNARERIGEASRYGKELAKDLECPVFYLSQLNRSVDSRPDKRPTMSDLRESGDLEQDADGIFMLYRDDYYNPDSVHKNTIEINTVKSREGETGSDIVGINLAESRVYELEFNNTGE